MYKYGLLAAVLFSIGLAVYVMTGSVAPENPAAGNSVSEAAPDNPASNPGAMTEASPDSDSPALARNPEEQAIDPELEAQYRRLNENPDYPSLKHRLLEMRSRRDGKRFSPAQVVNSMASEKAWDQVDAPGENLKLTEEERHDGRVFLSVDPMKVESLVPGDEMQLPMPDQRQSLTMSVDRVKVHGDGNVSWYGHVKEYDHANQVSITRGESLTVGGITTPEGHYTVQARDDQGWLVDSDTLFKRDPSQTDAIVPDIE